MSTSDCRLATNYEYLLISVWIYAQGSSNRLQPRFAAASLAVKLPNLDCSVKWMLTSLIRAISSKLAHKLTVDTYQTTTPDEVYS